MTHTERWVEVAGHPKYEVSDLGRVRSRPHLIECVTGQSRWWKGRVLTPTINTARGGYMYVHLSGGAAGDRRARLHVVVLESFIGPRPDGMDGCHNDGNPLNNTLSNLRWDTRSANQHDVVRHGNSHMANRTCCPHGHPLIEGNLRASVRRRGHRGCESCRRGQMTMKRLEWRHGLIVDQQVCSDAFLAEFLGEITGEQRRERIFAAAVPIKSAERAS